MPASTSERVQQELWNHEEDEYVIDTQGFIWLVTRDGGMVTRASWATIKSAGMHWLEEHHGPLTFFTVRTARDALRLMDKNAPLPDQS